MIFSHELGEMNYVFSSASSSSGAVGKKVFYGWQLMPLPSLQTLEQASNDSKLMPSKGGGTKEMKGESLHCPGAKSANPV